MPEIQDEPKAVKIKLVEVTIIKQSGDVAFVSYYDKTIGTVRVTIPATAIQEGKAPIGELEMGIPSPEDIDWLKMQLKPITGTALAKAMHDEGIFTKQDLTDKRTMVIITINRVAGLLLKDIMEQL